MAEIPAKKQKMDQSDTLLLSSINEADEKLHLETTHLTDIKKFFPELVWEKVMQNIKTPEDIENCSNSTPFFQKFLEKKRETFVVLPKVFELLLDYLDNDNSKEENNDGDDKSTSDNESMNGEDDDKSDNDNDKTYPTNNLLKCREVCKSWNNAIDLILSIPKPKCYKRANLAVYYDFYKPSFGDVYLFHHDYPFYEFHHHFGDTHYNYIEEKCKRNPFIGRQAEFFQIKFEGLNTKLKDELYILNIHEILRKYGTELLYAKFDFDIQHFSGFWFCYEVLRTFLRLVPNLKVLRLKHKTTEWNLNEKLPSNPGSALIELGNLSADTLENLVFDFFKSKISDKPLPLLTHLQHLETEGLPTPVFNELIDKNRNLFEIHTVRTKFSWSDDLFPANLPNLTILRLKFFTIADFEKFESCEMSMKLKQFSFWYEAEYLPWSRLFRALENNLRAGCEELTIQFPKPMTSEQINQVLVESQSCRLNVPKLQRLTLFDDMAYCLDFLLSCKISLECIFLRHSNDENPNSIVQHIKNKNETFPKFQKNQLIKFLGFKEKMEESNIWGEFPKLKYFTIIRCREMGGCISYCDNLKKWFGRVQKKIWFRE